MAAFFVNRTDCFITSKINIINKIAKFNTIGIKIFYLFKLNEEYSTLVWSIKKHLAKELLEISDEQFVHRVNEAFVTQIFI
jgi:2-polyprenyl-6-methoxyphenol hydroxylase-like FAD-dependent oxidoreductase